MKVCRYCRTLNEDVAIYCENCGERLAAGGATGHTIKRVQLNVGAAELDRLVVGGTASLGQTNAAQQLHGGIEIPVVEVPVSTLSGPLGYTSHDRPEWDQ
ncbi:MAG: hypothetical protein M1118_13280 [Chloroflexi bacterium]|nr:hypothetical protein [Chloroflexota bacterium]